MFHFIFNRQQLCQRLFKFILPKQNVRSVATIECAGRRCQTEYDLAALNTQRGYWYVMLRILVLRSFWRVFKVRTLIKCIPELILFTYKPALLNP